MGCTCSRTRAKPPPKVAEAPAPAPVRAVNPKTRAGQVRTVRDSVGMAVDMPKELSAIIADYAVGTQGPFSLSLRW
jgi:hypothetical protein